jgi:phenylacetate-CoA ligase
MKYYNKKEETISLQALKNLQNYRLRKVVERCYNTIPYYKEVFDRVGLKPKHIKTTDDLIHVPFTEKKNLRGLYPFPVLGHEPKEIFRFCATTGTTGPPVLIGFTRKDWFVTLRNLMGRMLMMWGIDKGDIVYQAYGLGLWIGGPSKELGVDAVGATLFPAGPGRSSAAVEWLKDIPITVLLCSPTFAVHLIGTAKSKGIDPSMDWKIRIVMFGGEKAPTEIRRKIENELPEGCKSFVGYGLSETGGPPVANECICSREQEEMHIFADHVFPEIIDSITGERVGPGEKGELVLTTLTREASPMIRWRTRDITSWAEKPLGCKCHRNAFPKITPIIGRSDDMVKVRGTMFWPSQVEDILSTIDGLNLEGWQIYLDTPQDGLERVKVCAEATEQFWNREGGPELLKSKISSEISARLGQSIDVEICTPDSLPRYERKALRLIRTKEGQPI